MGNDGHGSGPSRGHPPAYAYRGIGRRAEIRRGGFAIDVAGCRDCRERRGAARHSESARTKEPQSLVRIGRTGELRRGSSGRRNGFVDGRMPVGKVSAKARYLLRILVVVRPVAGAGNTGAGRPW